MTRSANGSTSKHCRCVGQIHNVKSDEERTDFSKVVLVKYSEKGLVMSSVAPQTAKRYSDVSRVAMPHSTKQTSGRASGWVAAQPPVGPCGTCGGTGGGGEEVSRTPGAGEPPGVGNDPPSGAGLLGGNSSRMRRAWYTTRRFVSVGLLGSGTS